MNKGRVFSTKLTDLFNIEDEAQGFRLRKIKEGKVSFKVNNL